MLDLKRRQVLQGLAAVSVASLYGCNDTDTGDGAVAPSGTLNVLFHGPFIFVLYSDKVEAIMPEVAGHVYGAGTWRKEYALQKYPMRSPSDYVLNGLPYQNSGSSYEDLKIKFDRSAIKDIDPAVKRYCKIVLKPRPAKIVPMGWFSPKVPGKLFLGNDAGDPNKVKTLGSSHACVYHSVTGTPSLTGTDWKAEKNNLNATNLHIIATPVLQLDMQHPIISFDTVMQMLQPLQVALNPEEVKKEFAFTDPACTRLEGVFREEQAPLRAPLDPKIPDCSEVHLIPPQICDAPSVFVNVS